MKVKLSLALLSLTALVVIANGSLQNSELPTFLSESDKTRLRGVVKLSEPLSANDVSSIYYYVNVISLLDKAVPESAKICTHIQSLPVKDVETAFFVAGIGKLLSSCSLDAAKYLATIQTAANAQASVGELHKSSLALAFLGKNVDSAKYSKLLFAAVKKDESLLNLGLALQIAAKFPASASGDKATFLNKIGNILAQADEIDSRSLQFEGGLGVSAAIIQGVYQLSESVNKAPSLTTDQVAKYMNYFISRRVVLSQKGASDVVETLSLFTSNKHHIPYSVSTYGSSALSAENPILTIKITNILGQSVAPITLTGVSFTKEGESAAALTKIVFKPVTGDSTLFAYDFFEKPLPAGVYKLLVDATLAKADSRVFRNTKVEIPVSILAQVEITNAEFGSGDSDVASKTQKLNYPSSLSTMTEVDKSHRLLFKFQLQNKVTKTPFEAQQTFVRFYNEKTAQEVIFVAEKDSSQTYKLDLNLEVRSKDFGGLSGAYQVNLFVGDSMMINSINWKLGSVILQLDTASGSQKSDNAFGLKKEIKHIFREPDVRPHAMISTLFTGLVMVPAAALLIMWYQIGINFRGFRITVSALLFHASIIAIFLLYACFFVKLNMFQTVKYLFGFGVVAYFSGHSLLAGRIKQNAVHQESAVNQQKQKQNAGN